MTEERRSFPVEYYVTEPFLLFFPNNAEKGQRVESPLKDQFLNSEDGYTYDPVQGFGIYRVKDQENKKTKKKEKVYELYTDAYVFKAKIKYSSEDKSAIGLYVYSRDPMKQRQTLNAAVRRVQVLGLDQRYILALKETGPQNIRSTGIEELLRVVDQAKGTRSTAEKKDPNRLTRKEKAFLNLHESLVKAKQEYEEKHLFVLDYRSACEKQQNTEDGVIYDFIVGELEDEILNRLGEGTNIAIPIEKGKYISGTVDGYEEPGHLLIKFRGKNRDYLNIPHRGRIEERENPEYRFKLTAIQELKEQTSPNRNILKVMAEGVVSPLKTGRVYHTDNPAINESQKEAIDKALRAEDFLLVQGPPGTGKTTIITEMISKFVKDGKKVLICSKNNLAVDNVLEKCQNLYYDEEKKHHMQCVRLGSSSKVLESVQKLLPRPLTMSIQETIRIQSDQARQDYLAETKKNIERYRTLKQETEDLCRLLIWFLDTRQALRETKETLDNKRIAAIVGNIFNPLKKREISDRINAVLASYSSVIQGLSILLTSKKTGITDDTLQQYLDHADELIQTIRDLNDDLSRGSIYNLLLGESRTELMELNLRSMENHEEIRELIRGLRHYHGNPLVGKRRGLITDNPEELSTDQIRQFRENIALRIESQQAKWTTISGVLEEWHEELKDDQSQLEDALLHSVPIVGATCIGVNTNPTFQNTVYDVAIVDESGQIPLHDLLVPMVKAKKVILIGDHLQLPPGEERDFCDYMDNKKRVVTEEEDHLVKSDDTVYEQDIARIFSVSLFEMLFRNQRLQESRVMLDTQYRMHETIAEFISQEFYEGKYKTGVAKEKRMLNIAGFDKPIYFIDTSREPDHFEQKQGSAYLNECEANLLADILGRLVAEEFAGRCFDGATGRKKSLRDPKTGQFDVGVITAYKGQIGLIRTKAREVFQKLLPNSSEKEKELLDNIPVNTLDSFQGRDNEVILYSFVRSNKERRIGFLNEVRRLNVMMTRAKSLLIMVGDSGTLTKSKACTMHNPNQRAAMYYDHLIEYCKKVDGYKRPYEIGGMRDE